jgi:cobalt-zinc-cadmium efflux system membrane fusion protein
MSTQTLRPRNVRWIPLAVAAGAVIVAGTAFQLLRQPAVPVPVARTETVQTVPEGEAGVAGDLVVTQEAMQLAEIKLAPAEAKLVSEKLAVSGTVQAGGDRLVKVTPRVAGKVVKLFAGIGDDVRAGQALAVIESAELGQAQAAYRQAAAKLAAAQSNLDRQRQLAKLGQFGRPQVEEARTKAVEADREIHEADHHLAEERSKLAEAQSARQGLTSLIGQAKSELEVARTRLDRAEALFKEELISKQELERIRADHLKAKSDVEVAEANAAQGEARIKGAEQRVEAAEGELKLAKRRATIIQQSLSREEKVYKGQFLTNREVVQAEADVRQAQVEAHGAADAIRLLGGRPGGGNMLSMVAPIAGRVQERTATLGETIDPEHASFTVVNLDQVWAQLAVAPRDLPSVRVGDEVQLTSETAPGRIFKGTVLSLGTAADETTRAVSVRTALANSGDLLKPGSFVRGTVVTDVRRNRTVVPADALQDHTGRPTIYVSMADKPGAFEVRHVKLGVRGDGWREISEGLKPGERIATHGTFYLKSEALKDSLADGCCAPGA